MSDSTICGRRAVRSARRMWANEPCSVIAQPAAIVLVVDLVQFQW
jgi:hypothetical protein